MMVHIMVAARRPLLISFGSRFIAWSPTPRPPVHPPLLLVQALSPPPTFCDNTVAIAIAIDIAIDIECLLFCH